MNKFLKIVMLALFALPLGAVAKGQVIEPLSDTVKVAETNVVNHSLRRQSRGISNLKTEFVPKGQWVFGGSVSYSTHTNSAYKLLVVDDIDSRGYSFKVSPLIGYSLIKNSIIGVRFGYTRSFLQLDSAQLNIGEGDAALNFGVDYYYALKHSYDVAAIWRQYIPLGRNKRFAIFAEMQLGMGGSQSKFAEGSPIRGTYSTSFDVSLGVNPGFVAFLTNNMALEVNVGVLGINYSHTKQVHNQIYVGDTRASSMNFKVNILSIGLGVAFYL
jgi:hypothetical protein